jgi:hypothetical protein
VTSAYGGPDEAALKSRRQSNQSTASKGTGLSKFQCQEYGSCEAYPRTEPQQQTATADVLKVISRSTLGLQMEIKERSKTMQIQPSMIIVSLLATILLSPIVQAMSKARVTATARSSHADLAQLEAPIGHRQPTLDDLPPWLRDEEKPNTEANPPQDTQAGSADVEQRGRRDEQRRTPRVQPNDDGVPRICDPC